MKAWGLTDSGDQEETVGSPPTFSHVAADSGRLGAATWRLLLPDWEALSALSSATDLGGCARPVWGNRAENPVNASYLCGPCKHSFSACSQESRKNVLTLTGMGMKKRLRDEKVAKLLGINVSYVYSDSGNK